MDAKPTPYALGPDEGEALMARKNHASLRSFATRSQYRCSGSGGQVTPGFAAVWVGRGHCSHSARSAA